MFCANTTPFYVILGDRFTDVKTDNRYFLNHLLADYYSMSDSDRDRFDEAFCKMSNDSKWALYKILGQAWRFSTIPVKPEIEKVIFNDPATIVFWGDGTKTVVKAVNEPFDPEKGLAMAFAKHALGNEGNYYNEFRKWLPKKPEESSPDSVPEAFDNLGKSVKEVKEAIQKSFLGGE